MNAEAQIRTFGSLKYVEGSWVLAGLPPHISLKVKSFFSRIRKTQTTNFVLADSPGTCSDLLWFMHRYPMLMTTADRAQLELGHDRAVSIEREIQKIMSPDWRSSTSFGFKENRAPYPYQEQAAAIAAQLGRLLLLDDVGLGKTVSALAAVNLARVAPVAVIADKHLVEQWAEDYIEPFTGATWHIIKGTKPYELPAADFYLFGYSNYAGWVDLAATGFFKAVVFDEIQSLRHGRMTDKGRAGHVFARSAALVIGLTATPIYNYGSEIWNLIEVVAPGALGTWDEFCIEWCYNSGKHWLVSDPKALGAHLRELGLVLRRTEEDVDKQLPPLNVLTMEVPFDQKIADQVADEARTLAFRVLNGSFTERGAAARELDMMARHLTFLHGLRGMVMISGYPDPLYDQALDGWRRIEVEALADGARPRIEVLWLNPRCAAALDAEQMPLFREAV